MDELNRRRFLSAAAASMLAGCGLFRSAAPDPRRAAVDRLFNRLQQDMRSDHWDRIDWAFSVDARNISSTRNHWEERWTQFETVDVQLLPGRILERDGLLNVQVHWNLVLRKRSGKFVKSSGTAEVILAPSRGDYIIRQILGGSFI